MALVDQHTHNFLQEAKRLLPEARREINRYQGEFMTQFEIIARHTQQLLSVGDVERLSVVFALAESYYRPTDKRYAHIAMRLSEWWLENLTFRCHEGHVSWGMMPRNLKQAFKDHWNFLGKEYWLTRAPTGINSI